MTQIISHLRKLIDVVQVEDLTRGEHFERELLLLKLKATTSQLAALTSLVTESAGRILSGSLENFVIELTSSEAQVTRFIAQASQHGELLEVVRSGALGITHGTRTVSQFTTA